MGHSKSEDGLYHIHGHTYEILVGSRAQVMHGTAYKTPGGLCKKDLLQNKNGRIVSRSKHNHEKKTKRLLRHGYGTKKGHFGYVKLSRSYKSHKRGGTTTPMKMANSANMMSVAMKHAQNSMGKMRGGSTGPSETTQVTLANEGTAPTVNPPQAGGTCGIMRGGYNRPFAPDTPVNAPSMILPRHSGAFRMSVEGRALNAAAGGGRRFRGGYSRPSDSHAPVNAPGMILRPNSPGAFVTNPELAATNAAVGGRRSRGGYSVPSASYSKYGGKSRKFRGGYTPPSASFANVRSSGMILPKGLILPHKSPLDMALGAGL